MTNTINVFLGALLLVLLPPVDVTTATIEPARTTADPAVASGPTTRVLAISVDGLNPAALRRLGPPGRRPCTGWSPRERRRSTPAPPANAP